MKGLCGEANLFRSKPFSTSASRFKFFALSAVATGIHPYLTIVVGSPDMDISIHNSTTMRNLKAKKMRSVV